MSQARKDDDPVLHRLAEAIEQANVRTQELIKSTDHLASEEYVSNLHDEQVREQKRYLWGGVAAVIFATFFAFTNTFLLINLNNVIDSNVESRNILLNQLSEDAKQQEKDREERYDELTRTVDRILVVLDRIEDRLFPPQPPS